jgi:hypothetical protein
LAIPPRSGTCSGGTLARAGQSQGDVSSRMAWRDCRAHCTRRRGAPAPATFVCLLAGPGLAAGVVVAALLASLAVLHRSPERCAWSCRGVFGTRG